MKKNLVKSFLFFLLGMCASSSVVAETLVELKGHVPPQLKGAIKLERVSSDERVDLSLTVQLDQKALDQAIAEMYGAGAPKSRHYLTSSEFAEKFGLAEKRQKLKEFAQANGLMVDAAQDRPESSAVHVYGPAAHVENAFHVKLHHYRGADGKIFRAHDTEPVVPESLIPHLSTILGLSNVSGLLSPASHFGAAAKSSSPSSLTGSGPYGGLLPSDTKSIYGLNGGTLNGSGQSVALVELDGYIPSDSVTFDGAVGLVQTPVQFIGVDGMTNLCGQGQNLPCNAQTVQTETQNSYFGMGESALDVDMVESLAPNVSHIFLYEAPNTYQGIYDIYNRIATDNTATVVSTSWMVAEPDLGSYVQSEAQLFQRMALQGQTVFAASGDWGASSFSNKTICVNDPASQPYVTGVGGTDLSGTEGSPSETAWSSGGGGISKVWPTPTYQLGISGTLSQQFRNVPDVALNSAADAPYDIILGGSWWWSYGTSAAAPLWAALTALANQQRAISGSGPLGFANPIFYQLGTSGSYRTLFNDITSGNNGTYSAGSGYDNVTGWGTFLGKGNALINVLAQSGSCTTDSQCGSGRYCTMSNSCDNLPTAITFSSPNNGTPVSVGQGLFVSVAAQGGDLTQVDLAITDNSNTICQSNNSSCSTQNFALFNTAESISPYVVPASLAGASLSLTATAYVQDIDPAYNATNHQRAAVTQRITKPVCAVGQIIKNGACIAPVTSNPQGIGVVDWGAAYQVTSDPKIVEGARFIHSLGAKNITIAMSANLAGNYPGENFGNPTNLTQLAQTADYQTVLNMPFQTYVLEAFAFSDQNFLASPNLPADTQEIANLVTYLMTTYQGTGKTFIIKNWEGDNAMAGNTSLEPAMLQWLNARHNGVVQGRAAAGAVVGVTVHDAAEFNLISPIKTNPTQPCMLRDVIPNVTSDMISYSAYDTTNLPPTDSLYSAILSDVALIRTYLNGKPLMIGEFGYAANVGSPSVYYPDPGVRAQTANLAFLDAGLSPVYTWVIEDTQASDKGMGLVEPSGAYSPMWSALQNMVGAPVNQAPTVNAGTAQNIPLSGTAQLQGTAADDGLPYPPGKLTYTWSKVSYTGTGAGNVTFVNPTSLQASATFSDPGTYVLKLNANDTLLNGSSNVTITVSPALTITSLTATPASPISGTQTTLAATITGGMAPLIYSWTPPVLTSLNNTAAVSPVVTFGKAGTYSFTLTVTDSLNQSVSQTLSNVQVVQTPSTVIVGNPGAVLVGQTVSMMAAVKDQFGDAIASPLVTWSSDANSTIDVSGNFKASTAGNHTVTATVGSAIGTVVINVGANTPVILGLTATPPSPIAGTQTILAATVSGGVAPLTYSWSQPALTSLNNTAAISPVVTFSRAGAYTFNLTLTDADNEIANSFINITVAQILTSIVVMPPTGPYAVGTTYPITATGKDQFVNAMTTPPTFTWSTDAGATIDASGNFKANTAGSHKITATDGSVAGSVIINLANNAPIINAVTVNPNLVTGTQTTLSVDFTGGVPPVTYLWSEPANTTLNTKAANPVVTFSKAGSYTFNLTLTDADSETANGVVIVPVQQTLTSIVAAGPGGSYLVDTSYPITVTGEDQFVNAMTNQPTFIWSTDAGATIDASGNFKATTAGNHTITATVGSVTGSVVINVTANVGTQPPTQPPTPPGPVSPPSAPDLSSFDGKTFSPTDTIILPYDGGGTDFVWEFVPVNGTASAQTLSAASADGSAASISTPSPRLALSVLSIPTGAYLLRVEAIVNNQASSWASATITWVLTTDLSGIKVYPNPLRSARGDTQVNFTQLPAVCTVKIFTVSGRWIKTLSASGGQVPWDLTNDAGERVASGLYLYLITDDRNNKVHGKLGVIR